MTGSLLEIALTVDAIAVATLRRPPVRENPVDLVARHDLAVDLVHELEVVRAERAGDPELRVRPVTPRSPVAGDRDPVGMRGANVVTGGMRVGSREHAHAHGAAAFDE